MKNHLKLKITGHSPFKSCLSISLFLGQCFISSLGATSWADFCHADSYTPGRTHSLTTPLIIVNKKTMQGALYENKREKSKNKNKIKI
jgi:hypothetical protein